MLIKYFTKVLQFLNLPPTLLDPPHPSSTSTIQQVSPITEIKEIHYQNKILSFNQTVQKPSFSTVMFNITLNEKDIQVNSVSAPREVINEQLLEFKSQKDHTDKQSAINVVQSQSGRSMIQMIKLNPTCENLQSFIKNGTTWYELKDIYGGSDTDELCCICLGEPPKVVALPCRHLVSCCSCAIELRTKNRFCPLCRAEIDVLVQLQ